MQVSINLSMTALKSSF